MKKLFFIILYILGILLINLSSIIKNIYFQALSKHCQNWYGSVEPFFSPVYHPEIFDEKNCKFSKQHVKTGQIFLLFYS